MPKEHEYGTKSRLLRIQQALLDRPFFYTRKDLSRIYQVDPDTITNDFNAFKNAGFFLDKDERYRYGFKVNKPLTQLKSLLHFSEEDQILLHQAIEKISPYTETGKKLKKKLASLYDYHRLGYSYLRKPYLKKVDLLLQANKEKRQVILRDYSSSNSNIISDRNVEPIHINPPDDTLQAFDMDKKLLRHFRISRIKRVHLSDRPWAFEGHHNIMRTDPFRIVDNNQVMVHLKLKVGAKNELEERFPLTKSYILESEEEEIYDFQCNVNHNFLGLTNFILGFYHQLVEVLQPESLLEHLREEIKKMNF